MTKFHPFGATTYNLGTSIGSTDSSILLSSFLEPVTNTPYTMALLNTDIAFGTISPKTSSSEFISFTGITQNANGTALLTGVTRGLAKKYPFASDSSYKLPHSGQSQFIISDAPQVFEEYAVKSNDEHITGQWTFDTFPVTPSNSPATTSALGTVKISTTPADSANPTAVGTNDGRVPVAYAVDSIGTDDYAITPSPAETAYVAGKEYTFKAGTANTGASTLNVSGLGAKTIKKFGGSTDLVTGDILLSQIVVCKYDGTVMQMISNTPQGNIDLTSQVTGALPVANGGTGLSAVSYASGIIQRDASASNGAVTTAHGLGVTPKRIKITCLYGTNSNSVAGNHSWSHGVYDGTSTNCVYNYFDNGNSSSAGQSTTNVVYIVTSTAADGHATASFDATNITLTWTKTGSPPSTTAQILWEAWGF